MIKKRWQNLLIAGIIIAALTTTVWYASSNAPAATLSPSSSPSLTATPSATLPIPDPTPTLTAAPSTSASISPSPTPTISNSPATPSVTNPPIITSTPIETPISIAPTPTTASSPTPTPIPALPINAAFNFNANSPSQSTPFNYTSNGVTAYFNSPSDPSAFSVQSYATTSFALDQLSGNYLYQNSLYRTKLVIRFSHPLTSFAANFATIDYHGPGNVETPSDIKLTVYETSTTAAPVGSVTARGTFVNTYPEGILQFESIDQTFSTVEFELPFLPRGATVFLIDNIKVTTV